MQTHKKGLLNLIPAIVSGYKHVHEHKSLTSTGVANEKEFLISTYRTVKRKLLIRNL